MALYHLIVVIGGALPWLRAAGPVAPVSEPLDRWSKAGYCFSAPGLVVPVPPSTSATIVVRPRPDGCVVVERGGGLAPPL